MKATPNKAMVRMTSSLRLPATAFLIMTICVALLLKILQDLFWILSLKLNYRKSLNVLFFGSAIEHGFVCVDGATHPEWQGYSQDFKV